MANQPGSSFVRRLLSATDCNAVNLDELTYAGSLNDIKDLKEEGRIKRLASAKCIYS